MAEYLTTVSVRNPHASADLKLNIRVLENTASDDVLRNVKANSELDLDWLQMTPPHERPVVIVGGGPSVADHLWSIREFADAGVNIFALNGASRFLRSHGIIPTAQVIIDAKAETALLVDTEAPQHIFASQVDPATVARVDRPTLVHLLTEGLLESLPQDRAVKGQFAMVGGGVSVGNCSLCLAYAMGHRNMHLFGFDSSHRGGEGHAYEQSMNDDMLCVVTEWAGERYVSSIAMKAQAEKFMWLLPQLEVAGCRIEVHGDGLLPAMVRFPRGPVSEKDKYKAMWAFDAYRQTSPAEQYVEDLLAFIPPGADVIDFGCGTGRASRLLAQNGRFPLLLDIADNCRDGEAKDLPFRECDLSQPLDVRGEFGICCDVMEHIPPEQVGSVLANISNAVEHAFFRIEFEPDGMGALINQPLHLSVHPPEWWQEQIQRHFSAVAYHGDGIFTARKL